MAATVRQRPTRRQLEVLRAYIATGSVAAAAHELVISESTVRPKPPIGWGARSARGSKTGSALSPEPLVGVQAGLTANQEGA
jgi:hypothetical protein